MKKLISILLTLILLPMAVAVNDTTVATTTATPAVPAGVTPDSPLWALDVFFDKLVLAFIQNPTSRAEFEIKVSGERLSEMNEMKRIGDSNSLFKALNSHGEFFKELEIDIKRLNGDDTNAKLKSRLRIDSEFEEHSKHIDSFKRELDDDDDSRAIRTSLDSDVSSLRTFIENELNGTIIEAEREFGEEEVKAIINGTLFEIEREHGKLKIEIEDDDDFFDDDRGERDRDYDDDDRFESRDDDRDRD